MINFIRRFCPDWLRQAIAPITLRFVDTNGLMETMNFLDMANRDKLEASTLKFMDRTQMLIAKELIRRGVPFWKDM